MRCNSYFVPPPIQGEFATGFSNILGQALDVYRQRTAAKDAARAQELAMRAEAQRQAFMQTPGGLTSSPVMLAALALAAIFVLPKILGRR